MRDREYYTRASSGETSESGSSSDSDRGEAVEEGAGEDEEKEDEVRHDFTKKYMLLWNLQGSDCLQDERPDVGNYDLDDNFIDDSEVMEFFDGLLKRKPKYDGFCIAKVCAKVPFVHNHWRDCMSE